MKTKAKILSIAVMLLSSVSFAQGKFGATAEDSVKCIENLSLYQEYFKQKQYKDARKFWQKAMAVCPASRKSLYVNGVKMYRHFHKQAKTDAEKKAMADSIMWIYDQRVVHFGQEGYVRGRQGGDAYRLYPDDPAKANGYYNKSIELMKSNTEPAVYDGYYRTLFAMLKKGEVEKAFLIDEYLRISDLMDKSVDKAEDIDDPEKGEKQLGRLDQAKSSIDQMFIAVAECPDIFPIVEEKINADPENAELMKKYMGLMEKRECTDAPIFNKMATKLHQLDPSASSAYSLGVAAMGERDYSKASDYFKQAIELGDAADMEKYYIAAGSAAIKTGSYQSAWNYANKALALNSGSGDAYAIKAQAVANSKCGTNAFEFASVYWLAYDYAEKAKSNGFSGGSSLMSAYKKSWPTTDMMFEFGILGNKTEVTIGCWIGESTKVREP